MGRPLKNPPISSSILSVSIPFIPRSMLDYNVPGGKLNRGLSVIDSYELLKEGKDLTKDENFLACALGWCIEWLQAYFLVLDDIMDNAHTRRGRPCWFRMEKVGTIAVNDGLLLRNHIPIILKKHLREKPYYVDLLDLFNETASGQMIDLITTLEGDEDLSKTIGQMLVCWFSVFVFLVACALLMAGEKLDNHLVVKNVLVEMGIYFQVQYESKSYEKLISSIEGHQSKAVQAVLKSFLGKDLQETEVGKDVELA
ncbi:hypothetical protein Sjap_003743 [Stephania japonica]|uniref:Farnesyl diphosphate synthase n=1 Tax=Stephania japonica TaxID=461633 RepID=A0AAP0PTW4_9MAGN